MAIKRKTDSHDIEKRTTNIIRSIIDADSRGLFREITGRDYGIDAMVEIFDDGCITGKFGLIQCKGKNDPITPLKKSPDYISCPGITAANIQYVEQDNCAVILTYGSVSDRDNFYYADLKDIISEDIIEVLNSNPDNKKVTVRIPVTNNAKDNIDGFFETINKYYL